MILSSTILAFLVFPHYAFSSVPLQLKLRRCFVIFYGEFNWTEGDKYSSTLSYATFLHLMSPATHFPYCHLGFWMAFKRRYGYKQEEEALWTTKLQNVVIK
jgi:hypothetical protein